MAININQTHEIKELLSAKLNSKLANYERETSSMPFLAKLMQDAETVAAYSFIHSLAITLGMSIYEQVAKIIASSHYDIVETSHDVEGTISNEENLVITRIMQEIKTGTRTANKSDEISDILSCKSSGGREVKIRSDLYLKKNNDEYFIEIKTAKPNIDVFSKSKQKLLEWVALRKKPVITILAIPYNPYYPEAYSLFTIQGVLDEEKELYVGDKFWDLLGGGKTFDQLLCIFDDIGKEFNEQIQNKIKKVARRKMEL